MITIKDKQMIIDGEELRMWVKRASDIYSLEVNNTIVQNCKIHVITEEDEHEIQE